MSLLSVRINRNIVECKGMYNHVVLLQRSAVLIETLWNVKSGIRAVITSSAVVLIETLWNVKTWTQRH